MITDSDVVPGKVYDDDGSLPDETLKGKGIGCGCVIVGDRTRSRWEGRCDYQNCCYYQQCHDSVISQQQFLSFGRFIHCIIV